MMPRDEKMEDVQYSSAATPPSSSSASPNKTRPRLNLRNYQMEAVLHRLKEDHSLWDLVLKKAEGANADHSPMWDALLQLVMWDIARFLEEAGVKCIDLITDALKQSKWIPLIEFDLADAYRTPFIGGAPHAFIGHLDQIDREADSFHSPRYAKFLSVVQSSGAGKSRMLTEVGRQLFTLPICLRRPGRPGYPLSDALVSDYFRELNSQCHGLNDSSTLSGAASFLTAAYETMLASLRKILDEENCTGAEILSRWHQRMEGDDIGNFRVEFFNVVMNRTKELRAYYDENPGNRVEGESPVKLARSYYEKDAKNAADNLMGFIKTLTSGDPLCVIYFDEAHELGTCFWIMSLLLQNQPKFVRMWYIFLETESSVKHFPPRPKDVTSLRLIAELRRFDLPYFALGFDQYAIEQAKAPTLVKMGDLETIKHISQYGRPLWRTMFPKLGDGLVKLAAYKLTAGKGFFAMNLHHVLSVLAQRLCLNLVLASAWASELAVQGVSRHMRLLTGFKFSADNAIFCTHSPSEPILAMGAARILYHPRAPKGRLPSVLQTLSKSFCSEGLIERGRRGELAARFLLLIARDYAAPIDNEGHRNLLKPVRLLDVLRMLFGDNDWCDQSFKTAFSDAFVNFTHWSVTKDFLLKTPSRKLLSNLWARGVILQCCFNQTSTDFLCPVYFGSVEPDAIFDCDQLSGLVVQVKNQKKGDAGTQKKLRLAGIICNPRPYLTLLMELGTESQHEGGGLVKQYPPEHSQPPEYERSKGEYQHASHDLSRQYPEDDEHLEVLEADVQAKEPEKGSYNCYTVSARGASSKTYNILKEAGIEQEFGTLFSSVAPRESPSEDEIAPMWPSNHFGHDVSQNHWMADYPLQ
ncbi:uncharacterized protein EI90DRAFT_3063695 [Cantharellus anzutake]|uniref:uncharacterized protein n=1 Tax=Cantharellus anzutake TaxID=1750568 RepID=UPI00190562F4|nr:uncharacterized protein EI90DRAFT_3063695 [Cantharellus anzutake]KAF8328823.1 hypothetical protein EI90DRAFT_3063695 [Cantharellus anzutake]